MRVRNWLWLSVIILAACTAPVKPEAQAADTPFDEVGSLAPPEPVEPEENGRSASSTVPENPAINRRVITDEEYSFPSLIPYDGIRPIYKPVFVSAEEAPYKDNELVMGVAFGGEAKAYPVTVLRYREMVNDEMAGIPTLVTW